MLFRLQIRAATLKEEGQERQPSARLSGGTSSNSSNCAAQAWLVNDLSTLHVVVSMLQAVDAEDAALLVSVARTRKTCS